MFNQLFFEYLMDSGNMTDSLLLSDDLRPFGECSDIEKNGLLKRVNLDGHIVCPDCGTMLSWTMISNISGKRTPLSSCPDCGVFSPEDNAFYAWKVNHSYILSVIVKYLKCSGGIKEILPETFWLLGRAPIAGQSREIFVGRSLCSPEVAKVVSNELPANETALLFVFGDIPEISFKNLKKERIFALKEFCFFEEDNLILDSTAIRAQLQVAIESRPEKVKSSGRYSKMGDLIIKLKVELRQYMIGVYGAIEQAESIHHDYDFRPLKQVDLARMMGVEKYTISRAMQTDLELKTLFEAAGNRTSAYAYGRKAAR